MKTTIKNLTKIEGASIDKKTWDAYLTVIDVYKKDDFKIIYTYNSKYGDWYAVIEEWSYANGFTKLSLKVFHTIEEVINQIYYITGEKKELPIKVIRKMKLEKLKDIKHD